MLPVNLLTQMSKISRFFIDKSKLHRGKFTLRDPGDIKKIRQVLRLREGEEIELFDGKGTAYQAQIIEIRKSGIKGKILNSNFNIQSRTKSGTRFNVILAQALTKAGKMDDIIKMNTEIGVNEFQPFESDYSVFKLSKFKPQKLERWNKIALEASRHSERNIIPEIYTPIKFIELFDAAADHKLLLHSRQVEGAQNIYDLKSEIIAGQSVLLAVGPEGGFSPKEVETAQETGFTIVYLNLPILRTETAGIVACGILLS